MLYGECLYSTETKLIIRYSHSKHVCPRHRPFLVMAKMQRLVRVIDCHSYTCGQLRISVGTQEYPNGITRAPLPTVNPSCKGRASSFRVLYLTGVWAGGVTPPGSSELS